MIVPVKFPETVGGFQENAGLLKLEGRFLVVEIASKDALFGVIQSDVKKLKIDLADVVHVRPVYGWFRTRLFFQFNSMEIASKFPGNNGPEVEISCKKKDRPLLKNFVNAIENRRTEDRLKLLEEEISRHDRVHE